MRREDRCFFADTHFANCGSANTRDTERHLVLTISSGGSKPALKPIARAQKHSIKSRFLSAEAHFDVADVPDEHGWFEPSFVFLRAGAREAPAASSGGQHEQRCRPWWLVACDAPVG